MKAGKYRELFNGIDTDRAADDKIKHHLLHHQKGEENMYKINKESLRRGKPIYLAFTKISNLRQAIPSVAFLIILAIVIIGTRASLLNKDITPGTNAEVSNGEASGVDIITEEETTSSELNADSTDTIASDNSEVADEAASETAEESPAVNTENTLGTEVNTAANADDSGNTAQKNGFYAAFFDTIDNNTVKEAIPNLIIRFHGTIDTINPDDFTDIVLTKDGIPVDNGITMTDRKEQFKWGNEPVTDFYFAFDFENREPGQYGMTGKYMGVPFNVYNIILEADVTDEPANPADFSSATFVGHVDTNSGYDRLTELMFNFKGHQNAFYPSDLTDLVITCDGQEVSFSYTDEVYRYYEADPNNIRKTRFSLILNEPLTQPGDYIITGKYKGVSFTSSTINIPGN